MASSGTMKKDRGRDVLFAGGVVTILAILFLPIPPLAIDMGLAFSIALSVLILMVALWIQKPLEFSAFPTVLLIATLLRLALSIASTRLILSNGHHGVEAAGHVISGFSRFVMSGDFVIGIVVFIILVTVNFLVITKGATRIAEVGARFTLDAIPGKQMAIDADLSAGLIDEKEAQKRRRELEEESAFFGSMDGASKFVRGEAVASLITIAVNIFGGIIIGVTRHGMSLSKAADIFTQLSVGDGLVSQIPALVVSLAAGLLVSKGGTRGQAQQAVLDQLGAYPRALMVASGMMFVFAIVPGLPMIPFLMLGGFMGFMAYSIPKSRAEQEAMEKQQQEEVQQQNLIESTDTVKESLKIAEVELCLGKHLSSHLASFHSDLAHRVKKMRKKFAQDFGFVLPDVKLSDSFMIPAKSYQIKIHGTVVATHEIRPGDLLVVLGDGPVPDVPGDEVREPAFGMKAMWISDAYAGEIKRQGFTAVDGASVLLTHLSEVIRNNLPQLLSYKDVRNLLDGLDSEYKRLLDDICPSQISYSGLQAVLKLLLAERVSIRNLSLILEAIAEIAPHARRAEQLVEHVRVRMAQQICGDLAEGGALNVLRLGNKWDITFHQSLKRDAKGDVVEFDIDPRLVEQFGAEASEAIKNRMGQVKNFAIVTAPDARPYVRMIIERMFSSLPVLSHLEIARGVEGQFPRNGRVIQIVPDTLLGIFLIFCRIGGCMLIAPALSSNRIPVHVRLFLALTVSLALSPMILDKIASGIAAKPPAVLLTWIGSETLVGLLIGLMGRVYFLALQTMLTAVAMAIGYGGMPGTPMDDAEPLPAISSLIMMVATALIFLSDLHWELFRGLIASYTRVPVGEGLSWQSSLTELVDQVGIAFVLALRISSPFLVYSAIVNLAAGLANKLTPQIPVFFIVTPFVMAGGLFVMYFAAHDYVMLFMEGYVSWLRN